MTKDGYINALHRKGYRKIGAGLFATVLAKPNSDIALKVARCDGWPQYILWAITNGHSGSFAPKVYSLKFHNHHDGAFYVAVMERLVDTVAGIAMECEYGRCSDPFRDLKRKFEYWAGYRHGEKPEGTPPDLQAFAEALSLADLTNDIHDGNIMVRKDGHLVVTDPATGYNHSTFRIKRGRVCC